MLREDVASRTLGITVEEVGLGRARLSMRVQKSMANGHNICHGGYIFTLADTAFAQRTLAASCSIDYLIPALGERRGIYDVKVTNQNGETVALFRGEGATVKGKWIE